MARTILLAIAALLALTALACGGSSTSSTQPPAQANTNGEGAKSGAGGHVSKAASTACPFASSVSRSACEDSYAACAATAKGKVRAFYSKNGPTLQAVATKYAARTYPASGASQAGFAGCLAALVNEAERSH
jgi:hypothetical protein